MLTSVICQAGLQPVGHTLAIVSVCHGKCKIGLRVGGGESLEPPEGGFGGGGPDQGLS